MTLNFPVPPMNLHQSAGSWIMNEVRLRIEEGQCR